MNDAGTQVRKFGESVGALARGEEPPADGYQGEYVGELAARLTHAVGADASTLGREAVAAMVEGMRAALSDFGVEEFDIWTYESALFEGDPSPVERTLALLEQKGHTYTQDGALWLATTAFGDDKDRPLIRSNGEHTYFASDIAYHQQKRERGFERQIDVWGADHHGYVARTKAAYEALGGDPAELELLIMQLVHLMRGGERAQMSKRSGKFVSLEDLVAEIGVDAARWYLLARSHDTTVDLDLDLASAQSNENPVYYVQYAHARIASILERAGEARVQAALTAVGRQALPALHPSERALIELLLAWPAELAESVAAARTAQDRRLRARARAGLHRLLPRLPRARGRAGGGRVAADRAVARNAHGARALPRAARGERARAHVARPRGGACRSVEARDVRLQSGGISGAQRRRGAGGCGLPSRLGAPAREQRQQQSNESEHDRRRHEVGGQVEPVRARQREHRRAVLRDQRPLDLRFVATFVYEVLDEHALARGLRGLRDVQGDFAGHAHDLAFDGDERRARRGSAGLAGASDRRRGDRERQDRGEQRPAISARAHHVLRARATARLRNPSPISPREIATMCPVRLMTKLSGSWSVP